MKNGLFAAIAVSFLVLAGCVEKGAESVGYGSDEPLGIQQLQRLKGFYDSINLDPDPELSRTVGDISRLAAMEPEKSITYGESMTKGMVNTLKAAESYRIIYADDNVKLETAVKDERMKISVCMEQSASEMIFNGSVVHSFSPIDMYGYKTTLSGEDMESYNAETLLDSTVFYPEDDLAQVSVSTVTAGENSYVCELFDGFAYLFRNDGSLAMFCDNSNNFTASIETENVPDSVFDIPEGYVISDYDK